MSSAFAVEVGALLVNMVLLVFWVGTNYQVVRDSRKRIEALEADRRQHDNLITAAMAHLDAIEQRLGRVERRQSSASVA